jgi:hypothetical protein
LSEALFYPLNLPLLSVAIPPQYPHSFNASWRIFSSRKKPMSGMISTIFIGSDPALGRFRFFFPGTRRFQLPALPAVFSHAEVVHVFQYR